MVRHRTDARFFVTHFVLFTTCFSGRVSVYKLYFYKLFRFQFVLRSHFFMAVSKPAGNTAKPPTKSEIYAQIADDTGLTKKDVAAVFDSLSGQIKKNLGGRSGPGLFSIPGLLKNARREKACHEGQKGCQSLHRRRNDVQSQAGVQDCQGCSAERPERHGLGLHRLNRKKPE